MLSEGDLEFMADITGTLNYGKLWQILPLQSGYCIIRRTL
jgi:hypothetical protein